MTLLSYPGRSYKANYLLLMVVVKTFVGLCIYLSGERRMIDFVLKNF